MFNIGDLLKMRMFSNTFTPELRIDGKHLERGTLVAFLGTRQNVVELLSINGYCLVYSSHTVEDYKELFKLVKRAPRSCSENARKSVRLP